MKKDLLDLLNNIKEDGEELPQHERYLLIDGLNLFFRNFSAINTINSNGIHVGGLGGFIRSLGSLINYIQPTQVYVVFDGAGSSTNRKNLIPEYKSNRNITRVTKHELFDNLEEEDESKIEQITRIIQYLKTLPIKTISLSKTEADDVIAYLSSVLPQQPEDRAFIVSSDKDYLQLISEQVIVYRPIEKEYYTVDTVKSTFGVSPNNFLLYKVLMGDNSDGISGIKGLGPKKLFKLFPELTERSLSFDDILDIAGERLKEHVVYARVLQDIEGLENKYKVMDLSNPMITEMDKAKIHHLIENLPIEYHPEMFLKMYREDQLDGMVRNVDVWIKETFKSLLASK